MKNDHWKDKYFMLTMDRIFSDYSDVDVNTRMCIEMYLVDVCLYDNESAYEKSHELNDKYLKMIGV